MTVKSVQNIVHTGTHSHLIAGLLGIIFSLVACGGGSSSFTSVDTPPPGDETPPAPTPDPTCLSSLPLSDTGGTNGFSLISITDGLLPSNFQPIDVAFVPGTTSDFVVASKDGTVQYFNGACTSVNSVDLSSVLPVGSSSGEQGLLNIEFHPDYETNHFLFAYFTSSASTVNSISRMTVSFNGSGNLVVNNVVKIIDFRKGDSYVVDNHNGGGLAFAPDGSLLASVGDGGNNSSTAQDDGRLLGKVIRILPSLTAGAGGYSIPEGNMFPATNSRCGNITLSATACPEILAKGLRNPFRMSMDGNIVYLGDVGNNYEEINSLDYASNTLNFGWPTHDGPVATTSIAGYRNPILAYRRGVEGASFRAEDPMGYNSGLASVMLGDVYRGSQYDGLLTGNLFFGDFYDGYNRTVSVGTGTDGNGVITDSDGVPGTHLIHAGAISSYVEGPDGFVYLTRLYPGAVYRLIRQ
jgi:glucose/arabinose dehydrogenase